MGYGCLESTFLCIRLFGGLLPPSCLTCAPPPCPPASTPRTSLTASQPTMVQCAIKVTQINAVPYECKRLSPPTNIYRPTNMLSRSARFAGRQAAGVRFISVSSAAAAKVRIFVQHEQLYLRTQYIFADWFHRSGKHGKAHGSQFEQSWTHSRCVRPCVDHCQAALVQFKSMPPRSESQTSARAC